MKITPRFVSKWFPSLPFLPRLRAPPRRRDGDGRGLCRAVVFAGAAADAAGGIYLRIAAPVALLDHRDGLHRAVLRADAAYDALGRDEAVELRIARDAKLRLLLHGKRERLDGAGRAGLRAEVAVVDAVALPEIQTRLRKPQQAAFLPGGHEHAARASADAEVAGGAARGKIRRRARRQDHRAATSTRKELRHGRARAQ